MVEKKLNKLFLHILKLKKNINFKKIRRISEKKWDSLAHVNLIVGLENEFNIKISASDAENINSYKSAILIINEKRKNKR